MAKTLITPERNGKDAHQPMGVAPALPAIPAQPSPGSPDMLDLFIEKMTEQLPEWKQEEFRGRSQNDEPIPIVKIPNWMNRQC